MVNIFNTWKVALLLGAGLLLFAACAVDEPATDPTPVVPMGSDKLYQVAKVGTKQLIQDYVNEIADALEHIASLDDREVSHEQKLDFFRHQPICFLGR